MASLEPTTHVAFAVYSADDNSLNFYKRDTVPTAGSRFNGKTATAVYTGIETDTYSAYSAPWYEENYNSSITSVSFVDSGIAPVSTAWWFYDCSKLTIINGLDKLDTSNVTRMDSMFRATDALTTLDLSSFDTSNVTSMDGMFMNCALTTIDLSGFDTSSVTNMGTMFSSSSTLTTLDLSSFDTSNVTSMKSMFHGSTHLTTLDLSSFNTSKVKNTSYMFYDCRALTNIYVSDKWSTAKITSSDSMFTRCTKLPNFSSSVVDKTNAHYNSGGYLTYKAMPHILTFNSNTGIFPTDSFTTKSVKIILDGTVSLSSLVEFPVKSGYVFRGWSTSSTGVVTYAPYATPTITEDTTLYAVWVKAESYLVREDTLANIANAIRAKTGGTDAIALNEMATTITALGPTISASGDTLTITN